MPGELIPSFLFYCYVNGITPGPANLSSLSASMNYGRRQALKQWRGLFTGFFLDALAAAVVCALLGQAVGDHVRFLTWIGAAYIVWLAVHIYFSDSTEESEADKNCNFWTGLLVQLTNVKVILFCITALGSYVRAYTDSLPALFLTACFLPFTGPVCNLAWLFAGVKLRGLFLRHRRLINTIIAVSLLLCAVNLLLH